MRHCEAAAIGVSLGLYRFDDYRGEAAPDSANGRDVESVQFVGTELSGADSERALRRAAAVARGVNLARDLSNEPASTLTPEEFASRAQAVAQESDLEIEVLGPAELAAIGAAATLAVGGGSVNTPRLIRLRYQPADNRRRIAGRRAGRQGDHVRHRRLLDQTVRGHAGDEGRHGRRSRGPRRHVRAARSRMPRRRWRRPSAPPRT